MADKKPDVLRATDDAAIRQARTLLRMARHGALAVLDPNTSAPLASRVGLASDHDGAPLILVSALAAHTGAILADPRCSLLIGEPGKGDPLAHARITLACRASRLVPDTAGHDRARRRYLNRNPKAKLYAGLGDFSFFRLEPESASLNGGFGRAYGLSRGDLLLDGAVVDALAQVEPGAVEHMNADHRDAISAYAVALAGAEHGDWTLSGIDAEGIDLIFGDDMRRIFFPRPLASAAELRPVLVELATEARSRLSVNKE